jgi:type I restriction enzyme S subunit
VLPFFGNQFGNFGAGIEHFRKLNRKTDQKFPVDIDDFEFPDENGKPYKSNGGKMVWCEELEKEIPEGWEMKFLSELSLLITKGTTPQKFYSIYSPELIPFIKIQSISKTNFVNPLKLEFIDLKTHNELKRSQILEDDILFSITGTLGEFAKVTSDITPANTNQNIAIIRINQDLISVNFIYWLFINGWHFNFLLENKQ